MYIWKRTETNMHCWRYPCKWSQLFAFKTCCDWFTEFLSYLLSL